MSKAVNECSSDSLTPAVTSPSKPEEQQSQPHTSQQQQEPAAASDEVPKSEILQQLMSEALKKVLAENPTLASTVDASSIRIGIDPVTQELSEVNKTKKQLYHRPPDTPSYNPTPIKELKKRKQSVDGVHNLVYNPTCSRTTGDKGSGDEGDVMGEFSSDESEEIEEKNDDFDLLEEVLAEHSKNNKVKVKKKKVKELGKLQYSLSNAHKATVDNNIMITDAKKLSDKEVKKYELPQTESVNKIITDGPYFLPPSPIFTSSSDGFEAFSAKATLQEEETSVPEECVDATSPHTESVKTNSQPATEKKTTSKQTVEQPKSSSQPENAEKVTKASGHAHLPQLLLARGAPKLSRPNIRTWTPLVRNNLLSSETQKTGDQLDEILQLMDGSDPSSKRKLKENEHQTSNKKDSENLRPKKKYKVDLNKEIESLSNPALEHSKESVTPEEPAIQQPEPSDNQDSDRKSTKESIVSDEKEAAKRDSPKESEEKEETDGSKAASMESEDSEGDTLSEESGDDSDYRRSRHKKKRKRKRSRSSSSGSDYSHHRRKKRKRSHKRHHKRSKRSRRRRNSTSSLSDQSQESEEEREEKKNDEDEEEENDDTEEEEENGEEEKENKSKEDSKSEDEEDSNDDIEHTRKSKRHRKKHKESSKSRDKRVDEENNKNRKEDRRKERSNNKLDQQTSNDKKGKNHNDDEVSIPMPVDPSKIKVEKNALVPDLSKVKIEKEDQVPEKSNGQVNVSAKSKESCCKGQSESDQSKVAEKIPEQRRPSSEDKGRRRKSHERKDSTESTSDKTPHRRQSCDSKASDNEGSLQRKKTEERRSSTEKIKRSQSINSQPSEMSMFDLVLASAQTSKPAKTLTEISMFDSVAKASTNHSLEPSGTKNKSKDASHKDGSSSSKSRKPSDTTNSRSEKDSSRHSSRRHSSSSSSSKQHDSSRKSSSSSRPKDSKETTTAKNNVGSEITKKKRVSADEESRGGVSDNDGPSSGVDSPLPDLSMLDEISQDDWEQMISGMDGANQEPNEDTDGDDVDTDNPFVLEECMKMFNEFQPEENHLETQVVPKKIKAAGEDKEPPKSSSKQRVARSSTGNLMAKKTSRPRQQKVSPMQMMVERFQKMKEQLKRKEEELYHLQGGPSSVTSSSSSKTSIAPSSSSSSSSSHHSQSQSSGKNKKRIAHVPNVNSLLSEQEKIKRHGHSSISSRISAKVAKASGVVPETTAHTVAKGGKRIAHTPRIGALAKPIIQPELGSLVPQNIRQRYLNALIEECKKFTSEKESFNIAAAEERVCYKRAPSRMVYLNLVVNAVKRLRTQQQAGEEAQELLENDPQLAEKMCIEETSPSTIKPSPPASSPSSKRPHPINPNHVHLSHTSVLSSGGIKGSWSIEKPKKSSASQEDIKGNEEP
ncbi:RNA exonuclease 1 [Portunus trituberculatus]|uniref:RNA exonuclease 1 n=1 Tax=Portunus trituberculatus TaxID=210409 RepID=A0A5B7FKV1_PORTR|nr:RNA exonuclease 1 [Portunus trituberculatus]